MSLSQREAAAVLCLRAMSLPVPDAIKSLSGIALALPPGAERALAENAARNLRNASDAVDAICRPRQAKPN